MLKNPNTKNAAALKSLSRGQTVVLTGTPVQNNLSEFHSLMSLCCPTVLGSLAAFERDFCKPIDMGNVLEATTEVVMISSKKAMEFRKMVRPYFLRRTKESIESLLPNKADLVIWLKLTPYQIELYETFMKSNLIDKTVKGSTFVATMLLQKICNHPQNLTAVDSCEEQLALKENRTLQGIVKKLEALIAKNTTKTSNCLKSCKLTFILQLLEKLKEEGHKVLIFSQTRLMLDEIEEALTNKGVHFARMDGTVTASKREAIIKGFQSKDGPPIFLMTTKVGGIGLNLTNASRVIIADPSWNPSLDNQCVDRVYRIGQEKNVIIYRLITSCTIEERIYEKQVSKEGIFKAATEERDFRRYINKLGYKEFLKLPEMGFGTSLLQKRLEIETMTDNIRATLKSHLIFLRQQGIVGVSVHNTLFEKTINLPPQKIDMKYLPPQKIDMGDENRSTVGHSRSQHRRSLSDSCIDWSELAVNPKAKPVRNTSFRVEKVEVDRTVKIEAKRAELECKTKLYEHIKEAAHDSGANVLRQMKAIEKEISELTSQEEIEEKKRKGG